MSTEIVKAEDYGLEKAKAKELTAGLGIIKNERKLLIKEFDVVSKLEINGDNLVLFRDLRLKIMRNRTQGIEKWHKTSKEYFLAGGKFIDSIRNQEKAINELMEEKLMEGEKFFENQEKERLQKLQDQRVEILSEFVEDADERELSFMDEDVWEAFLATKKKDHFDRIKAVKDAEIARKKLEEKAKLDRELFDNRQKELQPYYAYGKYDFELKGMSEEEYQNVFSEMKKAKEVHDKEQAEIKAENDRLKLENEAKAKLRAKRNEQLRPYISIIRDYEKLITSDEEYYQKELKSMNAEAIAMEKKKAKDEAERKRLEKLDSEIKLLKAKEEAELQANLEKGDQEKIVDLTDDFEALKTKYTFESAKNKKMYSDIGILIDKTIAHILK